MSFIKYYLKEEVELSNWNIIEHAEINEVLVRE